ncbi:MULTISPECIES: mechanosensitive ion channel family protein [Aquitalea]|uniref:Small-conductance mechanosensitive channel n=1 Tax=Aquitalea magnusonii TaxID=332411 RepID=A0A318JKU2_9NEIS|nr:MULTISPECIES: mechanosensitive ion channel domain-containing protein [Aquitalea]PXX50138.1 mechanosensitive ion channel-like protein [Aquitalea magnusonii]
MARILLCILALLLASLTQAAEPRLAPDNWEQQRTLVLGGQPIYLFMAKEGELTAQQRVARVQARLQALEQADASHPVEATPYGQGASAGYRLSVNGKSLFNIVAGDLDPADGLSLQQSASNVQQRLNALRLAYLEEHSSGALVSALAQSLAGSVLFAALLYLIMVLRRRALLRVSHRHALFPGWLSKRQTLRRLLQRAEGSIINLTTALCVIFLSYLWLTWLLGRFPYTLPWSRRLGSFLWQLVATLAADALSAVPGLLTVGLIFLFTRLLTRGLQLIFDMAERGQLRFPGLHPETAGATRRLLGVVLWLFALTVAYPYLPGADSDAFKGMSVFFGLLVTLGSAGIMNHAMSGLVLVYSRALRPGDFVRIGDVEGVVTELSALSTKILTRQEHEVTLPNAVVVGGKVENYSRTSPGRGLMLTTTVTIGYDTPWRQVKAMLELAAHRTSLVDHTEAVVVRQLNLQDFYVEYELQLRALADALPQEVRSELHGHIQDTFNEFGVQIMSPHFMAQPEQAVVVPAAQWYAPPAQPAAAKGE